MTRMLRPRLTTLSTALLAAILLGGCASLTRSEFKPVSAEMPKAWSHVTATPISVSPWWHAYGDAQLNALIEEVRSRNADMAAAAITLHRARLTAGLADDKLIPSLGASITASRSKELSDARSVSRAYSTALTVSYEADLWGKLASARDAKQWEALATEQDKESTELSLIGNTATLYWEIAYLNQRIAISEQSIAYTEKTLALAQAKFKAGSVSRLDVLSAEQDLATQRATHTELVEQREEARTSFSLLFDGPPGKQFTEPSTLPEGDLPTVEAGLPASLLGRRPDLRAAELRLRESLATLDNTRTSYYPSLSLTGTLGTSSTALRDLLDNPVATIAAELTAPFLQYREMKLNVGISQADYDLAVVQFRQSLYAALGDVENALSARQQYIRQGEFLAESLRTARATEAITEVRYRAGAIELQSWLDAQEKRRTAEASLAENHYNQLAAQITLNLALGGDTTASQQ